MKVCGFLIKMRTINKLLKLCEENQKKPNFDPYISTPGVKININTVNIQILTPLFPPQA
jgi:hypothetical protein